MSMQSEFGAIVARDGRGALVTLIAAQPAAKLVAGAKLLVDEREVASGSLGDPELDEAAAAAARELMWTGRSEARQIGDGVEVFVDVTAPRPRLLIVGAVDLAGDLASGAATAGWAPFVIDPRKRFAQPQRFPAAEAVLSKWPDEAFEELGGIDAATYLTVITHDPKLDDMALTLALRAEPAYIGAMGSRRAQADRRERLLALGFEDEDLTRVAAPVGLDLGAVETAETAVSIIAEMIACKYGRSGGRLSESSHRIHRVPS